MSTEKTMDHADTCGATSLGKLHLWWLNEFAKSGGTIATGGHRGAYGAAFATLCKRGLLELDASFDTFGLFRISDAGRAALSKALGTPVSGPGGER